MANTYDRAGNRTSENTSSPDSSSTTNYSYTSTGRLKEVSKDDVSTTYGYDGLGRNLTTSQDSWASTTTTLQSWDGLQPVVQSTDTGVSAMLLRDATGLVALQSNAASDGSTGTLWNLQDRLGSTIATTTGGGYVTDLADYSDFGIPTHVSQGFAGATGFTGETSSPTTGLNSYYARSYEPLTGTWLTPDSYRGTLTNPATQARYGYVAGNPATSRDANGNRAVDPDKPIRPKKNVGTSPAKPTSNNTTSNSGSKSNCQTIAYTPICSSSTSIRHAPKTIPGTCGGSVSFDQRPCTINDIPKLPTVQQKAAGWNWGSILNSATGALVGIGVTLALIGVGASIAACVVSIVCGIAVGVGAAIVGGIAATTVTYNLDTGGKKPVGLGPKIVNDLPIIVGTSVIPGLGIGIKAAETTVLRASEVGLATGSGIAAENLTMSTTVLGHLYEANPATGQLVRTYMNSSTTIQHIMESVEPVPDPGGIPGGLRWDALGTLNGTNGTYELVVDVNKGEIVHYLFRSPK